MGFTSTYIGVEFFDASVGADKDDFESAVGGLGSIIKVNEDGSESLARWTPRCGEIQGNDARLVGFQGIVSRRDGWTLDILQQGGTQKGIHRKYVLFVFIDRCDSDHGDSIALLQLKCWDKYGVLVALCGDVLAAKAKFGK